MAHHLLPRFAILRSMQFSLFTDRRYHGERVIEIDLAEVVSARETTKKLIFASAAAVTEVELTDGRSFVLEGHVRKEVMGER